ncbi:MAG: 2-phospho-L-lactate guanylyltransferase [Rubrobacteraceae bacterium]|nr:2-phospho-L-lactate guanylyltransferase [Rubrobacter sp.]
MRVYAIVPVKDLREAKSRLRSALDPEARADLALRMMEHVLSALREANVENVCVVSPDETVLNFASKSGATPLVQESRGLNRALELGRRWAMEHGASELLVLPADLPLLEPEDVRALLEIEDYSAISISPDDARSGTNAFLLRPPDALTFHFGPGSFEKHLRAARERGLGVRIVERPGIAFDLDTAGDLARLGA